jgi:hypothetical protein
MVVSSFSDIKCYIDGKELIYTNLCKLLLKTLSAFYLNIK